LSTKSPTGPESSGFLNRWSARKRRTSDPTSTIEVDADVSDPLGGSEILEDTASADPLVVHESDAAADENANEATGATLDSAADEAQLPDEAEEIPLLTDADMPPIESLTAQSDLSDFFNKGVSAALKRAALRHVFSLPVYNVRDGLNDYDDDYTKFEPLGDTITSDMKWHKARKEREEAEALAAKKAEEEAAKAKEVEEKSNSEEVDEADAQQPRQDELNDSDSDNAEATEDGSAMDSADEEPTGDVPYAEAEVQQRSEHESAQNDNAVSDETEMMS